MGWLQRLFGLEKSENAQVNPVSNQDILNKMVSVAHTVNGSTDIDTTQVNFS